MQSLNKLFNEKGKKFKLSAQGRDLAPFIGNGTKVKITSEIKLSLESSCQSKTLTEKKCFALARTFFYILENVKDPDIILEKYPSPTLLFRAPTISNSRVNKSLASPALVAQFGRAPTI